ncbi:MAG: radical SAM protein [Spirochaetes bacterium]|nr:radical SAM protein [Spirochaetota bacterium]
MKIAFIEPRPPFNLYFFLSKLPLLGPIYLGTILKKAGHEVKVFKEDMVRVYNEKTDELHPYIREADAVGITAVTHSANRAYQIADAVGRQFPDKRILLGGSHPSALPKEALRHADRVVVGEGENVVCDVFEGRTTDRIVYGTRTDLDELPPLELDLLAGYQNPRVRKKISSAPIMASRGCPHDCIFCSVTNMFGKRYRIRDADLVMEEVMLRYSEGFRSIFFYDDNFAAVPEKTKIFLEKLIKADLDFTWSSQFSIHVAKDRELVDLLKRAHCTTLFIGVESINPQALKDYRKSQNVGLIKDSIATLVSAGLNVHSMFILGADSDDAETIEETIRFSRDSKSSTAQFSILFPIPGTELFDNMRKQDRIFVNDWDYFDGTHSVILHKTLSPLDLQKKFIHAYRYFYGRKFLYRVASRLGFFIWKLVFRKYMRFIRSISRHLLRKSPEHNRKVTVKELLSYRFWKPVTLSYRRKRQPL